MSFANRTDAGVRLGARLGAFDLGDPVVLALPRGGVAVGVEVARILRAPLDVIVVRKLGVPVQPELAMGAVGEDGVLVVDREVIRAAGLTSTELSQVVARERAELDRRARSLREVHARIPLAGRTAVVVDDGVATGSTARAACQVARAHGAARVILAVPVGARASLAVLRAVADEVVCLEEPEDFFAVGQWYRSFAQVGDQEVLDLLHQSLSAATVPLTAEPSTAALMRGAPVRIESGDVALAGQLTVPDHARGIVAFAHGSASSRHSPRNRFVADLLNRAGIGTLLFDLLTGAEARQRVNVFDIALMGSRLRDATHWLHHERFGREIGIGYFGASTGAAAALWSAAECDVHVDAIVSRGGRPDLAAPRLSAVRAPTLLIVGGHDAEVLELNRRALRRLRCECRLAVVEGATHLFEEPGTLMAAADLAAQWFVHHLTPAARRAG